MQTQPTQPDKPGVDPSVVFASMRRGFRRVCPKCGNGRLFAGYLKPNAACKSCGACFRENARAETDIRCRQRREDVPGGD